MDSGFLESGDILDDDYDVSRELLPEQVVGVMDSLLSLEVSDGSKQGISYANVAQVAWYMGYPLSITLFSSVYVEKILWPEPNSIEEACFIRQSEHSSGPTELSAFQSILRAYCLSIIKTCDFVLVRILRQGYYEVKYYLSIRMPIVSKIVNSGRRLLCQSIQSLLTRGF